MAKDYSNMFHHLSLLIYHFVMTILLCWVPMSWWPKKDVGNEIVLITGGANGLGRLLAIRFAKLGSRIVILDVDDEGSKETSRLVSEQANATVDWYHCDVSNCDQVNRIAKLVKSEIGTVTILINNAGIVTGKALFELNDEDIRRVFEINTLANFWTVKAFVPDMMTNNHGHVVSMSSVSGSFGVDLFIDYSSSKHALNGFDESLKLELIRRGLDGVHTTLICPFLIRGGFFDGYYDGLMNIIEPEYAIDQITTAVLTNTEVMYLPKSFYLLVLLRPIISRNMWFHMQNFMADRGLVNSVTVRPYDDQSNKNVFKKVK